MFLIFLTPSNTTWEDGKIILSSLLIALTYLGAEDAQLFLKIPSAVGFVFQGLVLFFLLGTDFLNKYKVSMSWI